jgi:hypothetical protein
VKLCYDLTIENIRDKSQDNFVWVSIDETQDCERRHLLTMLHVVTTQKGIIRIIASVKVKGIPVTGCGSP